MRLDYKILWIEDNDGWRNSIKLAIEKHIKSKGFNPIIKIPNKVTSSDINKEAFKDFDLLLIDYMLKPMSKEDGDFLIEKIREHKIFTNIVFYSSDLSKLNKEIKEQKLNGVYIFERSQLDLDNIADLYDLIDFFMERDMDVASLRGIAMSEVAEFDSIIWDMIKGNKDVLEDSLAKTVKDFRLEKYEEFKDKTADKIWETVDKKGTSVLDSFHMHKFLCDKVLRELKSTCVSETKQCIDNYHTNILKKRNHLAHGREVMSPDEQVDFRKDLIQFRNIFNKLKEELCRAS